MTGLVDSASQSRTVLSRLAVKSSLPVAAESNRPHDGLMIHRRADELAGRRLPYLGVSFDARGRNPLAVRAEGARPDEVGISEFITLLPSAHVP